MDEMKDNRPLTFKISCWWGIGFSAVFLLYGAVTLVLGFLDRKYDDMATPLLFLVLGAVLLFVAYAYRSLKKWGWYGQIAVNGLIIVLALIGFNHYANLVLLVLAAAATGLMFSGPTKEYLFGRR